MVHLMSRLSPTLVKDTLKDFLYYRIENDSEYIEWAKNFTIPRYITDNLSRTLRGYQEEAVKHFIWIYDQDPTKAKHLLFNMSTGAGKTLTMAAVILFLYEKGYRNFIFMVHQLQIIEQAYMNFIDPQFEKYLFNKNGVKINGRSIPVKEIKLFPDSQGNAINFMFLSTAFLYNKLVNEVENGLSAEDFLNNKIVLIADEAHRLNVNTRKKIKEDDEAITNWETSVNTAIKARPDNLLLEFTATVDLGNSAIHRKYQDKLVYKYDFLRFNKEGYSKAVCFLYNTETQIADQKRLLVINAVVLSEYRRLFAERDMQVTINPIILVKSTNIKQSKLDREFFHKVINSLKPQDLDYLKKLSETNQTNLQDAEDSFRFLRQMFAWIASPKSGLSTISDRDGLKSFISEIKIRFSSDNTFVYNSTDKTNSTLLPILDDPKNYNRVIFSVDALTEGWDVLSLYDIIHFDISAAKKVSLQDIQLIGRGARLCPYKLHKSYRLNNDNLDLFDKEHGYEFDQYKRKFDNAIDEYGRVLETFMYHFVKTGTFYDNLKLELLGEGIINKSTEKHTITLKSDFMNSETYKKGFVLVNQQEFRNKTTDSEIDTTFKREIKASAYQLHAGSLTDKQQNQIQAEVNHKTIDLTEEYFSRPVLKKALVATEGNFFRFNYLREHIVGLDSMDELIDNYLPLYQIRYSYTEDKDIHDLTIDEKYQLLLGIILPEVRKAIDRHMPRITGSKTFKPKSLSTFFLQEKNIYLVAFPVENPDTGEITVNAPDERAIAQSLHPNEQLKFNVEGADWYAYSENYGTSEEKLFVKFISTQIDALKRQYKDAEIYLIRNELDYWLFSPVDGRRFSPDYMLIVNDTVNQEMYYQCLIEPKGGHLLVNDEWKEEVLISLSDESSVIFDPDEEDDEGYKSFLKEVESMGYKEIKCLGFKFFNSDPRDETDFALDFRATLPH